MCDSFILFLQEKKITRLIVHGLKTSTHTHRYIHEAVYNTFVYVSNCYPTIRVDWYDDTPENKIRYSSTEPCLVFSSPLFNTDQYLPIVDNSYYILVYNTINWITKKHITRYDDLLKKKKAVKWSEFRYIPDKSDTIRFLDESGTQWYDSATNTVHMPWATNIFPEEINKNIQRISSKPQHTKENGLVFVGSIWHRNCDIMKKTQDICKTLNIKCSYLRLKDELEHSRVIREAYIAPAIQGEGHKESETTFYIPCRIFKNISFGTLPITNNKGVYNLFSKYKIVYHEDVDTLIQLAIKCQINGVKDYDNYKKELIRVMEYVRDNHTYINRFNTLIQFL